MTPRTFELLSRPVPYTRVAMCTLPALALLGTVVVVGKAAPPAYMAVALATEPLSATAKADRPTLALALAVEHATVGAQYVRGPDDSTDDSYEAGNEYLGYYDAGGCYRYVDAPTESIARTLSASDYKRFRRTGDAAGHRCDDAFSGNFMNWASSSAIDMLRLALTGGDRYVDSDDLTVLQRAVVPSGNPACMWNTGSFPAKQLHRDGGGPGAYWGAVPKAMARAAGANDIWVANAANKIYFGTARSGDCADTRGHTLNSSLTPSTTRQVAPGAAATQPVPTSAPSGEPLNSDGYFYARVEVCSKNGSGALEDVRDYGDHAFCVQYPNGTYKPTGTIQRYSDRMRVAAFGYLLDQPASTNGGRYGGVLRTPMKYVGAKTFDTEGRDNTGASGNPNAEWDTRTGVFTANPDGDTTFGISGVINYLNRVGRTGAIVGRYNTSGPVSELYYETLRYLQGLQPSDNAVKGMTAFTKDGYPAFDVWSDPYADRSPTATYACQKNNLVVIGGKDTSDGSRFPAARPARNVPDLKEWTDVVRAFESGKDTIRYLDGQGQKRETGNPDVKDPAPATSPMVGYAYWAHTQDIRGAGWTDDKARQRPGMRVKTFVFDIEQYGDQTVDATHRRSNPLSTTAKYGGFETMAQADRTQPFNTWGNPFRREDGAPDNDVWQDPARPGEASTYYRRSSARGVLEAFDGIFRKASTAARTFSSAAVQPGPLDVEHVNVVYQAAFDTGDWSGNVSAAALRLDLDRKVVIDATPRWNAADRLQRMIDPSKRRNIVVGNEGATSAAAGLDFKWADIAGTSLRAHLDRPAPSSAPDGLGEARLDYLRGSNAREGTAFRVRNGKLLGDIVNSGVVYSGAPTTSIDSTTYAAFRQDHLARAPAIFAGANDGMLHAFDATTGDELFGYIPSWLGPRLSALTNKSYGVSHQAYVDATPTVAEAMVGSIDARESWKTVLVGGTGAGGRGVYALDVTEPSRFAASNVLWEFTSADDPDLGFVVGKPEVRKFRISPPGSVPAYKWFAVVAGGVNSYVPDPSGRFGKGEPAIFLLDLAKPASAAWSLGANYFKLSLPFDTSLAATIAPGVTAFSVALGKQQEVASLFAGDLHGNLWKFDFRAWGSADWSAGKLSAFNRGTAAAPQPYPLYVARDGAGKVQPIGAAPLLGRGPAPDQIYVAFGTGKFLEEADLSSVTRNSFYVVLDDGSARGDGGSSPITSAIKGRTRLQAGTVDAATGRVSVPAFAWGRATTDGDRTQRSGWYFDYPASGERQVTSPALAGRTLVFNSLIPNAGAPANVCAASGGGSRAYRADLETGATMSQASTVGVLGRPLVLEIAAATTETRADSTGRRVRTIARQSLDVGSAGSTAGTVSTELITTGRLSWREVHNYRDLRK